MPDNYDTLILATGFVLLCIAVVFVSVIYWQRAIADAAKKSVKQNIRALEKALNLTPGK